MADAEVARRGGDFVGERREFEQAAQVAKDDDDRGEALYRRAASFVREGRYEEGATALLELAKGAPSDPRSARALLDAGRAFEKAGREADARQAYGMVFRLYPDSGGALSAARRFVTLSAERNASTDEARLYRGLLETNKSKVLDSGLRYFYARSLEEQSKRSAILAYEDVARHHPLPVGTFTDEALLRAAELRRASGDVDGALLTLNLLLDQGEKAAFVGSYVRTSYVKAHFLRGKILWEDKRDAKQASRAFVELSQRFKQSTMVDDALFENVRIMRSIGGDACGAIKQLERARPDSRFVRCEPLVCGKGKAATPRDEERCTTWLDPPERPAFEPAQVEVSRSESADQERIDDEPRRSAVADPTHTRSVAPEPATHDARE